MEVPKLTVQAPPAEPGGSLSPDFVKVPPEKSAVRRPLLSALSVTTVELTGIRPAGSVSITARLLVVPSGSVTTRSKVVVPPIVAVAGAGPSLEMDGAFRVVFAAEDVR